MEFDSTKFSVTPAHEDKGAEETPWELAIIRNIWRRAYMVPEEEHVKVLTEYGLKIASNERNRAIQECIDDIPQHSTIKAVVNFNDGYNYALNIVKQKLEIKLKT